VNSKPIRVTIILLAIVMWAIEPILAKVSFQKSDFIQTSAIRAIFAALTAFIYVGITNKVNLKVSKKHFPTLLYITVIGTLFADFMYSLH